jgi:hypothetical protein
MCEICPRVTIIRQRCSRAVDSRKSRAHKQLVQVPSVCGDDDCVISPDRAAAECTPPACVDRERLCERLFCELACLAANLNGRIRSDAKISGLRKLALLLACLQSRAEKSPLSGLAKGRGSCLRRSTAAAYRRSRRAAGTAERVGGLRKCKQRRQPVSPQAVAFHRTSVPSFAALFPLTRRRTALHPR